MITVLERQHVSKRASSPVAVRAQAPNVHWRNLDQRAFQRTAPSWKPKKRPRAARAPIAVERPRIEHSFLQGQLIKGKQRRTSRRALKALLRTKEDIRRLGDAQRPAPRPSSRRHASHPAPWWARRQEKEKSHPPQPAGDPSPALDFARRLLCSPWLLIGLCALAALLFTAFTVMPGMLASFTVPGLSPVRPALPEPPEADPVLYRLLIPEQTEKAAAAVSPVILSSLKVASYTARAGDTLSRIAARFKLNVDTVVSWNDIRDARALHAGMRLSIPNADGLKYTVRRGDTLQAIALSRGVDFNSVLDANMLSSSVITVGQELFLPGARMNPTDLNRILGSLFISPVQGRYSSFFGMRPDPFTGIRSFHGGLDIVNVPGTSILAAMAGRVANVGFNYTFGYYVIIQHSGGYQTMYGHLIRYVVSRGQKVDQGQKIGELGTTGYSTGPHLHFAVYVNGQPVDPLRFLK
jgi:murein DD-endopeptidase MepM/ murein hydrolase activator NlpD